MYYIVYGFFWLLSLLPLRVLYFLSDGIYCLVFYVFKYRRDVVMTNLDIAFPEKPEKEKKVIAKKFYHNLIDTFIETIKMISASKNFILKHFTGNWEVINSLKKPGRPMQLHLGHNFNWEWGNAAGAMNIQFPFLAVYIPLTNKNFERLFLKLRSRFGTIMLRATHMREDFLPYRNTQYLLGLAADQSPGDTKNGSWFNFFGRPTSFVKGPGKNAIIGDTAIVFCFIHKTRRGYYEAVFSLAEENPRAFTETELTGKFVKYLEGVIRQYPDMWLWSHRRWKHEWKEGYGEVIK
jgi:Kdo2-lipid IVA lauroyltransferase/acyltransferase